MTLLKKRKPGPGTKGREKGIEWKWKNGEMEKFGKREKDENGNVR